MRSLADLFRLHAGAVGTVFVELRFLKNDAEIALLVRGHNEPSRALPISCVLQFLEAQSFREPMQGFLLVT